jgi:hypothetical protein
VLTVFATISLCVMAIGTASVVGLEEFPWELTGDPGGRSSRHRLVFLRGIPPADRLPSIPGVGSATRGGHWLSRQLSGLGRGAHLGVSEQCARNRCADPVWVGGRGLRQSWSILCGILRRHHRPDRFDDYCRFHPNMKAQLVVERAKK